MHPSANPYIAVLDDDVSVCRSFGRLLRMAGFRPVTYHAAEEFLADKNRPHFACLVVDVELGGISGIDLRRRMAAVGDATPVVFISANDDPAIRKEAEVAGCAGYFRKTDPGDAILSTIRGSAGMAADDPTNIRSNP